MSKITQTTIPPGSSSTQFLPGCLEVSGTEEMDEKVPIVKDDKVGEEQGGSKVDSPRRRTGRSYSECTLLLDHILHQLENGGRSRAASVVDTELSSRQSSLTSLELLARLGIGPRPSYVPGSGRLMEKLRLSDAIIVPQNFTYSPAPITPRRGCCGIILAALSGAFVTLVSVFVRAMQSIDPLQTLFFRAIVQVALSLPYILLKKLPIFGPEGQRALVALQGILGTLTLVSMFIASHRLTVGDAVSIIFSCPVFVVVLSHFFLKERCGWYRSFIVVLIVVAVVFIARPPLLFHEPGETYDVSGYVSAILSSVGMAMSLVLMRKLKDVPSVVILFSYSTLTVLATALSFLVIGFTVPKNAVQWTLLFLVGPMGILGQLCLSAALQREDAGPVAVARSMDVVLAFGLQVWLFAEIPRWTSILGAGIVVLCVVGIALESALCSCVTGNKDSGHIP